MSLAFTTYQTNRLFLIGVKPDGSLSAFERYFDHPMGLWAATDRLVISTRWQIWELHDALPPGETHGGFDRVYVPRRAHTTGHLDTHDVAVDADGRIIFVNTLYSCLAELSDRYSFKPIWKPPFISKLAPEDRCHLNGLALAGGRPAYVTAVSRSDAVAGWRDRRHAGGCVIDVEDDEIVLDDLSMPHSPRLYDGRLWVLNSGTGEIGWVNRAAGRFESLAFCPGYLRGLAFHGPYAIVGLSKQRNERAFCGLALDDRLREKDTEARCGIWVIDLRSGDVVHWMQIEGVVTELYDVAVIPTTRRPMALGFKNDEIERLITIDQAPRPLFTMLAAGEPGVTSAPPPAPAIRPPRAVSPEAEAAYRLGNRHAAAERFAEAILHYEEALRIDPAHVNAWVNLGTARFRLGDVEAAERCWERALQVDPRSVKALGNLALLRRDRGDFDEAIRLLETARAVEPRNPEVLHQLAPLLSMAGRGREARQVAEQLVRLAPGSARAHSDLGAVLLNEQDGPAALASFERAVRLDPGLAEAWVNIGIVAEGLGDVERARDALARALAIRDIPIRALRLELIAPPVWQNAAELDAYRARAAKVLEAFRGRDLALPLAEIQSSGAEAPFHWSYHGRDNAALKRQYAALFTSLFDGLPRSTRKPGPPPWRVAFVVTPTHEGVFLRCMAGIVDGLDRRRFRPAVVCARAAFTEMGRHLKNRDVELLPLSPRFDLAVEQIRAASFDAIYFWEVGTDATNYFLPFCRMAPLQVTGWGWPDTSGAPQLDFHISSAALAPRGAERFFTEPLARLPHLPAFPRLPPARPRPEPPERFGLPKGAHVYFCAQNLRKVHFDMDPMLGGILRADPAAVAVFIDDKSPVLGELLRRRWHTVLADVAERLIVLPRLAPDDYMTLLASSHVVLDTPHFSGSNTAYDALIAGAPVVTLPGEQPRSRYTAALHESTGITELTAASPEQYVEIALRVANDRALREKLRERLRAAVSVAFENPRAVRQLEDFLAAELQSRGSS